MSSVFMLIGIPGSGKTTYAKNILLKKYPSAVLISSDEVRNNNPSMEEKDIWVEIYRLCKENIEKNIDIIYDATNITPNVRHRFDDKLKEYNLKYEKVAYYFITNTNSCYERVIKRNTKENERFLPPEVVLSYGAKIIPPSIIEGFSDIFLIDNNSDLKG